VQGDFACFIARGIVRDETCTVQQKIYIRSTVISLKLLSTIDGEIPIYEIEYDIFWQNYIRVEFSDIIMDIL